MEWSRPSAASSRPAPTPDVLVFAGPGGGNHVAAGTRACLTAHVGSHSSRAARTSQLW
jgi:hypothetical protein